MTNTTDEHIGRVRALREQRDELLDRAEKLRIELFAEVKATFPADGSPAPRGTLTKLVEASGWTRAYVADIRDGKVT